ncbi:Hemolysin-type calcium-binding repeat-containing protein [Tropicibacter naphthalenivorans]|uniref:Hemolysin, chromosomal n=1 Tax=Tropicibacter naphthalenivorans TaxID=441103 RepID=A0A0P1GEH8_9RHOB|nr:Hemolysin, chromosomal [Tropicibacter naphthalenivorans]SMC84208.1 Hemolysin-type calcium-binding repeat-containing protein [Tropicibacter naphthalenivorans]
MQLSGEFTHPENYLKFIDLYKGWAANNERAQNPLTFAEPFAETLLDFLNLVTGEDLSLEDKKSPYKLNPFDLADTTATGALPIVNGIINPNDLIVKTQGASEDFKQWILADAVEWEEDFTGQYSGQSLLIFGGAASDTLSGNNTSDFIWGGKGNDRLFGSPGSDTISGGEGHYQDSIEGGGGSDLLEGGDGPDHLTAARATTCCTRATLTL